MEINLAPVKTIKEYLHICIGKALPGDLPRGVRNNNPGNIRINKYITWLGQVKGEDKSFVSFQSPEFGIRAIYKLIINYEKKYGINTVEKFIKRYAPPNENDTNKYINELAQCMNISKSTVYSMDKTSIIKMTQCIVDKENGQKWGKWFTEYQYNKAWEIL